MQLFTVFFERPLEFGISTLIVAIMILVMLRAAMSAEQRAGWVAKITGPNGKWFFGLLTGFFLAFLLCFFAGPLI